MILPTPPAPLRDNLRLDWLLDERVTFLNHGSFGATPRVVLAEQDDWRRRLEAEPIEMIARRGPELFAAARREIGGWLGMREDDFGLVTNATEGINAVIRSLKLTPADELLTTTHVYNAVRQSMRYAADRAGATYGEIDLPVPMKSPGQIVERVLAAISDKTRLLVIDHVTSPTALIFPIEAIAAGCAERGVDLLVDGAHAPGMLPLNVAAVGAAWYAGNLHKWTCGPKGSAFLWARPDRQADIHPLIISHHFREGFAREFAWQGTRDFSSWLAVPRAIRFMAELGWENVMAHNHTMAVWANTMLTTRWGVESLSPADGQMLGSMASVALPAPMDHLDEPQVNRLQRRLYCEYHMEVPVVSWGGRTFLRPCCQVYNSAADYVRLGEVIATIASEV